VQIAEYQMTTTHEIEEGLLDASLADGSITEVLYIVRSGKEATVYCCRGGSESGGALVAAKVYRPLERRNFHNDALYRKGRELALSTRTRRALANNSRHGRVVQYGNWIDSEYTTIRRLHAAGADVPEMFAKSGGVLLMEYFGDESGAAPMLSRTPLDRDHAGAVLRAIIDNMTLWLVYHVVHGDLSPYNILYWEERIVAIDFPQAVDPRINPNARTLLHPDLENICGYFQRYGIHADANRIGQELWGRYKAAAL
jgi:RIO kinase 1